MQFTSHSYYNFINTFSHNTSVLLQRVARSKKVVKAVTSIFSAQDDSHLWVVFPFLLKSRQVAQKRRKEMNFRSNAWDVGGLKHTSDIMFPRLRITAARSLLHIYLHNLKHFMALVDNVNVSRELSFETTTRGTPILTI